MRKKLVFRFVYTSLPDWVITSVDSVSITIVQFLNISTFSLYSYIDFEYSERL